MAVIENRRISARGRTAPARRKPTKK